MARRVVRLTDAQIDALNILLGNLFAAGDEHDCMDSIEDKRTAAGLWRSCEGAKAALDDAVGGGGSDG